MNGQSAHHAEIGETLPLFERASSDRASSDLPASRVRAAPDRNGQLSRRNQTNPIGGGQDRHMRAAWQLSNALKAAKNGRKAGRNINKLTPVQKHQVGNAICEHLLASLRAQVQSEQHDPPRHYTNTQ